MLIIVITFQYLDLPAMSNALKMQLDVDIEPTFRFTYMRYYIDKQKNTIINVENSPNFADSPVGDLP